MSSSSVRSLINRNQDKRAVEDSSISLKNVFEESGVRSERSPEALGVIDIDQEPIIFPTGGSRRRVNPHETGWLSWGRVYANEIVTSQKLQNVYPEGSVIVREKYLSETDTEPAVITVMAKRRSGFSSGSGDWEYFVLNGGDLKVLDRQKKGSCAKCHAAAELRGYVFGSYFAK